MPASNAATSAASSALAMLPFPERVAVGGRQVEPVDPLEIGDLLERRLRERRLAFEHVEQHALEQIADRQVERLGEPFQDLQDPLLDADARLHPPNQPPLAGHGTNISRYHTVVKSVRLKPDTTCAEPHDFRLATPTPDSRLS